MSEPTLGKIYPATIGFLLACLVSLGAYTYTRSENNATLNDKWIEERVRNLEIGDAALKETLREFGDQLNDMRIKQQDVSDKLDTILVEVKKKQ